MINRDFIDRVRNANDIVDVINEYVKLTKAGVNFKGLCPFHGDRNPSLVVSKVKQFYKCFVCGEGGDVFSFVEKYESCSFIEALKILADRAHIEFPKQELSPEELEEYRERESNYNAIDAAARVYQNHIGEAQSFLVSRGYDSSEKILTDYGVGYAPAGNVVAKELADKGWPIQRLLSVGVIKENEHGQTYDFFRDRLMFPFYDNHGKVVAFSGRAVGETKGGKYVNTGETKLFTKGNHIFGLWQAKKSIAREGFVYLVEGQFDVLSLVKYGVANVVGGSGTAFTDAQLKLLSRLTDKVVMVYDGDSAGSKAALKNCELFLKEGMDVQCVSLPSGEDPDSFAQKNRDKTKENLIKRTEDFHIYFRKVLVPKGNKDVTVSNNALETILRLVAHVASESMRRTYATEIRKLFKQDDATLMRKIRDLRRNIKTDAQSANAGIYGVESLKEYIEDDKPAQITSDYNEFAENFEDSAIVYVAGVPTQTDIQQLRSIYNYFVTTDKGCYIDKNGMDSPYMQALFEIYKSGVQKINVCQSSSSGDVEESFIDYYIRLHGDFMKDFEGEKDGIVLRCIELTCYAEESKITLSRNKYQKQLNITKGQFDEIRKPMVSKRKSFLANSAIDDFVNDDTCADDVVPKYVEENEEYNKMFKECGYYPRINKKGEPVCYMFQNKKGYGYTQVADFYMTPLLHIFSDDFEVNKRILKINRRYYEIPIYIEVQSKSLLKKSTIEEVLINYEAVNFSNGEEWMWTKIREYMSRHYITCSEIDIYGNQQTDGMSRKADEQFFAFSNGIYHIVDGVGKFEPVNELGVVTHNKNNYYLPAYSTIYAGRKKKTEKYELICQLTYREVPESKRVTFEQWAKLMVDVYRLNNNGHWALLFAIMCAFRSNIHCIDRLFTAPFFIGPMSSGKTQIAVSIRSLFGINPNEPIFNLCSGSDAGLSTLVGLFRDVPVVLEEYNNKDVSEAKFQALKGIVYDGDGKQKRRNATSKEIAIDKVFAPAVIVGQETPERDDNSLMRRVIICEVPKSKDRTPNEVRIFEKLKDIENPNKVGLSNVLIEILKLRPMVMDHFRELAKEGYNELKEGVANTGERDRLMRTVSLFLGTVKLIEQYSTLQLPFTYSEFFQLAQEKIVYQLSLIQRTDKLALFFSAMSVMVENGTLLEGREFSIETPTKITGQTDKGPKAFTFDPGTRVMFIRLNTVFAIYDHQNYNREGTAYSQIENNLKSHPSYITPVKSHRFVWTETEETQRSDSNPDMSKQRVEREKNTSCIAINYDVFRAMYNTDMQKQRVKPQDTSDPAEATLPGNLPFD